MERRPLQPIPTDIPYFPGLWIGPEPDRASLLGGKGLHQLGMGLPCVAERYEQAVRGGPDSGFGHVEQVFWSHHGSLLAT